MTTAHVGYATTFDAGLALCVYFSACARFDIGGWFLVSYISWSIVHNMCTASMSAARAIAQFDKAIAATEGK